MTRSEHSKVGDPDREDLFRSKAIMADEVSGPIFSKEDDPGREDRIRSKWVDDPT